jgi:hypothetical protein
MRVFPKRYDLLLAHLIEVLTEGQGPGGTATIIEAAARRVASVRIAWVFIVSASS